MLFAAVAGLSGCTPSQNSPSIPFFGAYFPSWLICLIGGVVGAVVVRVVFVRIGLDDGLPFRLLVYSCMAAAIGFILALAFFGR
ncbi:MAG: hypothetical protein JNK47_21975 [Mesorhizobium sp.]|nr:hypothetical protein [Mesorhizobium sp.]